MTVKFYTEARSAVRAGKAAVEKLPETVFVTGVEAVKHSPLELNGPSRFTARIYFDHEDLTCLLPHSEILVGFELVSDSNRRLAGDDPEEQPEEGVEKPEKVARVRTVPENRRNRRVLSEGAVLRPTGEYSGIGKGIHLQVNNAFDGVKPLSQVISELQRTLDPPRSKGWEQDPIRYIREYVSYNLGQGALTVVSN